jgi:UDP-N-acetylmuramoyl-L-alanyl-D-glutamate--2,6-diaminopimelate ligase
VTTPLDEVLKALSREGLLAVTPPRCPAVTAMVSDSRRATPGAVFLAVPGTVTDGHQYVAEAVARGAQVVVVECHTTDLVPEIRVRDASRAARVAAAAWYGDPASSLVLVGVTGTNGKTTTTTLIRHLLNRDGDVGNIGTLGAFDGVGGSVDSTAGSLTTPGPVDLHATFAAMVARGVRRVAMEASSHSLDQGRLDGLVFSAAVFTNLTRDHLDYHGTMERYLDAKLRLAGLLAPTGVRVVNQDDPAWKRVPGGPGRVTFGLGPDADLRAEGVVLLPDGSRFHLRGRFGNREVALPLPGDFNVTNALAAAAAALALGQPLDEVAERLSGAPQVPGRMERLAGSPCLVLRDYAHTPDALERALRALRGLTRRRLIVLFGCGGDRDRGKRPLMGAIAARLADLAIVTSDNPRTEDPERIIDEVVAGMPGASLRRLTDRRAAIALGLELAGPGDTLLLAGKGHETHQVIGATKYDFDERTVVRELGAA